MAKSSIFKARLKVVTVLVDRQLYGSEFHTEGELRLEDFADIARDIRQHNSKTLSGQAMAMTYRIKSSMVVVVLLAAAELDGGSSGSACDVLADLAWPF